MKLKFNQLKKYSNRIKSSFVSIYVLYLVNAQIHENVIFNNYKFIQILSKYHFHR